MTRFLSATWLLGAALGLVLAAGGCAYPKRSTPLREVGEVSDSLSAPPDIWWLTVVAAEVPPERRGGLSWDDGGGQPDPQVKLYRGGDLLWSSETADDTTAPRWAQTLPKNVRVPSGTPFRIELWDHDEVGGDPIGVWKGKGLPSNVLPGAEARVMLDSGATVTLHLQPPHAHEGSGIARYEVRSDALRVLEVHDSSPAGRAGIREGDRIVAVADEAVADLGENKAASKLSMARRGTKITFVRDGERKGVQLDGGYVWLSM